MEWEEVEVPAVAQGSRDVKTAAEKAAEVAVSWGDKKEEGHVALFNDNDDSASNAHRVRFFGWCLVVAMRACTLNSLPNTWHKSLAISAHTASWRDGVRHTPKP
jgi:hypothetical protein